jgi:hypothetical protein
MTSQPALPARRTQVEQDYVSGRITSAEAYQRLREEVEKRIARARCSRKPFANGTPPPQREVPT